MQASHVEMAMRGRREGEERGGGERGRREGEEGTISNSAILFLKGYTVVHLGINYHRKG